MNDTLSSKEAAERLKIKHTTLANWRSQGKGPRYYLPSGNVIYYKSDIDEWIKNNGRQHERI